jgi:hypothetical protein
MFGGGGESSSWGMPGSVKTMVGMQDEDSMCPSLSYQQRMYGFAGCFVTGWFVSFLSTMSLWSGNFKSFGIMYTFGSIVALCSSGFLLGPKRQCKNMCKKIRIVATCFYLGSLLAVIITAAAWPSYDDADQAKDPGHVAGEEKPGGGIVILLEIVVQFCAAVWYMASYIPFGRKMIKNCCGSCMGQVTEG